MKADQMFALSLAQFHLTNRYSPIRRKLLADPEIAKLKKPARRDTEAVKAYNAKLDARLRDMPKARQLLEQIAEAKRGTKAIDDADRKIGKELTKIRYKIRRGQDADIVVARRKLAAAGKAVAAAGKGEELTALRKAQAKAQADYNKKIGELMDADKLAAETKALYKERSAQSSGLTKKIRAAGKKKGK